MNHRSKIIVFLFAVSLGLPVSAQPSSRVATEWDFEEARQFDFWIGEWSVNNRFVQEDGSWLDSGSAAVRIYRILGGKAILEYWDGEFKDGRVLHGFSLRYYDPEMGKWLLSLNWPGPNQPGFGNLEGSFRHGRGDFYSRWVNNGQPVVQRYSFSDIGPDSLRWDDGISTDAGKTWKSNWIMEFSRTANEPEWAPIGQKFHTLKMGQRCQGESFQTFDGNEGAWELSWSGRNGSTSPARLEVRRVLDGCAVMLVAQGRLDGKEYSILQLASFLPNKGQWTVLSLDSAKGTGFQLESGRLSGTQSTLQSDPKPGQPLRRTQWSALDSKRIALERQESDDQGASWMTTLKLEGKRP